MSECERAGKWFGACRFEERFDKGPPDTTKIGFKDISNVDGNAFFETCRPITYVHDICIRCGKVVSRANLADANSKKEPTP